VRPDQFVAWTDQRAELTADEADRVLRLAQGG